MRVFVAIELPDKIKKQLASIQEELKKADADIKWVEPANIHLTLKFLGEVAEDNIPRIKALLDRASSGYAKFETNLFIVGAFPKLDYPRVIWVGMDKNCSQIEEIASKVDEGCESIGFAKEERKFSAHLTIGRVRSPKNTAALKGKLLKIAVAPHDFIVDKLALFQSTLTPNGPIYSIVHTSYLG